MWQYVYYILAAVNVLTISVSLLLHNDTVDIFHQSVKHQEKWVAIEDDLGALIPIFSDANVSTNEVFQSKNIKKEIDRFDTTYRVFQVKIRQIEEAFSKRLTQNNNIVDNQQTLKKIKTVAHELQEKIKNLKKFMETLKEETKDCFTEFQMGNKEKAAEHIANADSTSSKASLEVLECIRMLNHLESSYMNFYTETANSFEAYGFLVAFFVLLLMILATIYGYFLSCKLKKDERVKEEYTTKMLESLSDCELAKQDAEKKEIQIRQFLAYVSHEFRTPLNGILGFSQALFHELTDKQHIHYIESIKHAANSLLTHIKEILEFAKLESGKLALDIFSFNLKQALLETVNNILPEAQKKRISVCFDFKLSIPEYVKGDKARLQQIFSNFMGNALKFTAAGSIGIKISVEKLSAGRLKYTFSIKDSGIGIAEDKQKIIFEKFIQADESISNRYGGSGLGLAIANELVILMEGNVTVDSKEGEGATFTFTIIVEEDSSVMVPKIQKADQQIILLGDSSLHQQFLEPSLKEISHKTKVLKIIEGLSEIDDNAIIFMSPVFAIASAAPEILAHKRQDTFIIDLVYDSVVEQSSKYQKFAGYLHHPLTGDMLYRAVHMLTSEENTDEFIDNNSITIKEETSELSAEDLKFDHEFDILVAEDNIINQEILRIFLKKLGVQVTIAQNGNEAVELFKSKKFDLVFMDHQMPELNGIDATILIREYENESSQESTPIIACTADAFEKVHKDCLEAGMDDIVVKPVKLEELHDKIKKWCKTV